MDLIDNLYSIVSKGSRLHIFLKCTWNILQDWSRAGPKVSFGTFKKI